MATFANRALGLVDPWLDWVMLNILTSILCWTSVAGKAVDPNLGV